MLAALGVLVLCSLAALVLWWRRRQAERARRERIRAVLSGWMPVHPTVAELQRRIEWERRDVDHYGQHALGSDHVTSHTADIPAQRQNIAAPTDSMPLLSGDVFVAVATPSIGKPHGQH